MTRQYRPKAGFWIRFCVAILYPLDGLLFRIRWRHLERMPEKGGVIVVLNHVSHIDTVLMARLVWQTGRIPRFMIKNTLFDFPVIGKILQGAGQIPVYRGTDDASKSLGEAVRALEAGEAVVIYPEGTITRDPAQWPMQAKTGVGRLVLLAPAVPVIPVGQWGAQKTSKRNWLRRRTATASLGPALDFSDRPADLTLDNLRAITDEIMRAVRDQVAELRDAPAPNTFFRPVGKTQAG